MSVFFPFESAPGVHVSRVGNADRLRIAPNSRAEYMVLSSRRASASFTALVARYFPGEGVSSYSQFGERFALVLDGEVRLNAGDRTQQLGPGEFVHYASHPEDALDVVSHKPAEVLWLVVPAMV
jgi:quercetin dioxygenase-like cupin family protein